MSPQRSSPSLVKLHVLDEHGGRRYVYPADVRGRFTRLRQRLFLVLLGVYLLLPWISINGRPAVFIDISARSFFLFGKVFNAQDFYYVFFLLSGIGFALIMLAALLGRIWCGYACPQTVLLEGVFRPLERLIEGPASQREALSRAPWTAEKVARKALKHAVYVVFSLVIAHLFLAYFVSLPALFRMMRQSPLQNWTAFLWGLSLSVVVYLNFFWFREQLCLIVCPYGRLQSVMQDRDTVVIGYDARRGEPRGKVHDDQAGDCVDCRRCVAVCPTGIDIRNGLQMECIGCAGCIDACDEIMGKLARPRGLIRYDSERGLTGEPRRFLRPRLFVYAALGLLGLLTSGIAWWSYQPFEANLVRGHGAPYVLDGDTVRNQLLLHLINKRAEPATLRITPEASGSPSAPFQLIIAQPVVQLSPQESRTVPLVVSAPRAGFRPGRQVAVHVLDEGSGAVRTLSVPVAGPLGGVTVPAQGSAP